MNSSDKLEIKLNSLPVTWQEILAKKLIVIDGGVPLKELLFALRDMPYRRPSKDNSKQSCLEEWCGTCSAKHKTLYELLRLAGYKPKLWMAAYIMDFNKPYFSDELRHLSHGKRVYDVHNFVTAELNQKEILIDITFPESLAKLGFPVTTSWNESEDFVVACPQPEEVIEVVSSELVDSAKAAWLQELNSVEGMLIREKAIQEMGRVLK